GPLTEGAVRQLSIGFDQPCDLAFTPDGRALVSVAGTVLLLWDLSASTDQPAWEDQYNGLLFRFAVSPCGRYAAGAEDRCRGPWGATGAGARAAAWCSGTWRPARRASGWRLAGASTSPTWRSRRTAGKCGRSCSTAAAWPGGGSGAGGRSPASGPPPGGWATG